MRLGTYYRSLLLSALEVKGNKTTLLDIGSLDGYWLSQQCGEIKVCLDINHEAKHDGVDYIKADALALPFKKNSFAQVFSFDVMEHVADEKRFIQELWRVVGPNGQIIISVPNKNLRMFPPFLTHWLSQRWGHFKCIGYSEVELLALSPPDAHIELKRLRELWIRLLYLPLRLLWSLSPIMAKPLVRAIALLDRIFLIGECGGLLIIIGK